jgi:hypothetical protein
MKKSKNAKKVLGSLQKMEGLALYIFSIHILMDGGNDILIKYIKG